MNTVIHLFLTFLKIGLLSIGGRLRGHPVHSGRGGGARRLDLRKNVHGHHYHFANDARSPRRKHRNLHRAFDRRDTGRHGSHRRLRALRGLDLPAFISFFSKAQRLCLRYRNLKRAQIRFARADRLRGGHDPDAYSVRHADAFQRQPFLSQPPCPAPLWRDAPPFKTPKGQSGSYHAPKRHRRAGILPLKSAPLPAFRSCFLLPAHFHQLLPHRILDLDKLRFRLAPLRPAVLLNPHHLVQRGDQRFVRLL